MKGIQLADIAELTLVRLRARLKAAEEYTESPTMNRECDLLRAEIKALEEYNPNSVALKAFRVAVKLTNAELACHDKIAEVFGTEPEGFLERTEQNVLKEWKRQGCPMNCPPPEEIKR